MSLRSDILEEVNGERDRQDAKWGNNAPPVDTMIRVLGEEFGEVCRAVNDKDPANYREELIQTAATCVKMVELADSGRN